MHQVLTAVTSLPTNRHLTTPHDRRRSADQLLQARPLWPAMEDQQLPQRTEAPRAHL